MTRRLTTRPTRPEARPAPGAGTAPAGPADAARPAAPTRRPRDRMPDRPGEGPAAPRTMSYQQGFTSGPGA